MNEIRTILRDQRSAILSDTVGLLAIASLLVAALHHLPGS